jgi:hypothetical protein
MGAFADTDSSGAEEQESIGGQIIGSAQFLPQELVLVERKRSGQIARLRREVFATDEVRLKGVAAGGPVLQQPPETIEMDGAGSVTQGRSLLAQ